MTYPSRQSVGTGYLIKWDGKPRESKRVPNVIELEKGWAMN